MKKLNPFLGITFGLIAAVSPSDAANVDALQGLHGNTLVAGKTTAFRMYLSQKSISSVASISTTIFRADGSALKKRWPVGSAVLIANGSKGPSVTITIPGRDLPWVGHYAFRATALNAGGGAIATFAIPSLDLLPTKDIIVGVDRLWANDVNPGTVAEMQAARNAMVRLAAVWPIRDGVSEPDGDRTAGLRMRMNNNPKGPKSAEGQDGQLCPFLDSLYSKPPGTDVLNLGVAFRFLDGGEGGGGTAPHFCDSGKPPVGWVFMVDSGDLAPGFGQESGHVFGLEPVNDPHYDHNPATQAGHSVDTLIAANDSEQGFDIQTRQAFPSPTFDTMHQVVCGCAADHVAYNTWDWEFLRKHFLTFSSTGPELPTHFSTDAIPAIAGVGGDVYFIAKRSDGRLFYNRATLGAAGDGYKEMDGNGISSSGPSAAAVGTHLFVGVSGTDHKLYLNQADDRGPFGQWFPLNFSSDVAPGFAGVGQSIFMFAKGMDQKIYLNQAVLGHAGSGWFEVQGNGRTDASPSAAAVGSHIFVAIKGLDGKLYMNQADFGHAFGQWFPLNFSTDVAPALVAVNNSIFIFAKGRDQKIYVNQAVVGKGGSGWFEVQGGGRTQTAPAAGVVGSHLFVGIRGSDGRFLVNQADFGHAFGQWFN